MCRLGGKAMLPQGGDTNRAPDCQCGLATVTGVTCMYDLGDAVAEVIFLNHGLVRSAITSR